MPERKARAVLEVRAQPRASRDRVGPVVDGVLQVRVVRPALGGEANAAIRRLVAEAFEISPSRVRLLHGERGRAKRFELEGMHPRELARHLARLADPAD